MTKYDHIVVGSGVSGLTAALLLAQHGRRVLLLEKAPRIGGSLARFFRDGVPFDTGFHFTGGLTPQGLLRQMLRVLGLADAVTPVFMGERCAHRFVFEAEQRAFDLPSGMAGWRATLRDAFPGEQTAVDRYFDMVARVRSQTVSMDLTRLGEPFRPLDEEHVSLRNVLDGLTNDRLLKGVLSGLGMCYGVKPSEISFASHSRVCVELYESTARLAGGGETLVRALAAALEARGVEIRRGCRPAACGPAGADDCVERLVLDTGEEVAAGSVVLTIHPRDILALLPADCMSRAFVSRVGGFEPSAGFFTLYGVLDGPAPDAGSAIVSLFPTADFEQLLDPAYAGEPALVIVGGEETVRGAPCATITAFEPSFPEHVAAWRDSTVGRRPPAYAAYKASRVQAIREHIRRHSPDLAARLRPLDAASVLTFRDYLHSPDGSAYGIKQKLGQYNLIGRLPVRNFYAAGQSALLPGLTGAMMSAFMVVGLLLGRDSFGRYVQERLR